MHKHMYKNSPKKIIKRLEYRRAIKNEFREKQRRNKKNRSSTNESVNSDQDYGEYCQQPDLPREVFLREKEIFLGKLTKSRQDIQSLERETILQLDCGKWMEERRKLLTASNQLR